MFILRANPSQAIVNDFLARFRMMKEIDDNRIYKIATTTIKYLISTKTQRKYLKQYQELETKWYQALDEGYIDWSVYDQDDYLAELWACWVVYSRKYLISIQQTRSLPPLGIVKDLGEIQSVIDLGCGIGYTTAALKEIFPKARVIGTNLDNTVQMDFAQRLSILHKFEMMSDTSELEQIDLVFASEYFEHIPAPIDHLKEILQLKPKVLLIANAFAARAVGHFPTYNINGVMINGKDTSRLFNAELRKSGYEKVKTKLWNNRPAYWKIPCS